MAVYSPTGQTDEAEGQRVLVRVCARAGANIPLPPQSLL